MQESHVGCHELNKYIVYDSEGKEKSERALNSYIVVIVSTLDIFLVLNTKYELKMEVSILK